LPEVTEEQKPKLVKFLIRKLKENEVAKVPEENVYMPIGENGKSLQ
jgi:translation initiation factor 3 subunit B